MSENTLSESGSKGESNSYERRIENLEFVVSHLQKTIDDLNDAVLQQHRKIDMLARQMEQAKSVVQSVLNADNTPRSLADDKPPHY